MSDYRNIAVDMYEADMDDGDREAVCEMMADVQHIRDGEKTLYRRLVVRATEGGVFFKGCRFNDWDCAVDMMLNDCAAWTRKWGVR